MEIEKIIAPEIIGDEFHAVLKEFASLKTIKTILEIGSSSGGGSTSAFVEAIRARGDRDEVSLFCMEVSTPRYEKLRDAYAKDSFVHCFNKSAVPLNKFPSKDQVIHFYNSTKTNLNHYPLETVLQWLVQDIEYVKSSGQDADGIEFIKQTKNLRDFDLVLIDGSEFTGEPELWAVKNARFIALDDVNSFKCYNAYHSLLHGVGYKLARHNFQIRNGYAVFERLY